VSFAVAVVAMAASGTSAAAATSTPDDPGVRDHQQWGLTQAGFPDAWCRSTGAGALIVVIDTGIDASHPDLARKLVGQARVRGGELSTAQGAAADDSGHGTHVAGIAAAVTGNGIGVAGAAPDARLYAIKVLFAKAGGGSESGSESDLVQAIDYASGTIAPAWPGPVVLNLSIGAADASAQSGTLDGEGPDIDAAMERASQRGLGVAVAAGNAGTSAIGAAAVQQGAALAVGALDQNGHVAPYSPTAGVSIFAAGGSASGPDRYTSTGILSTWPHSASGDYAWMAGTSMAAPHVAAALALLMSSGLSSQQAYTRLLDTADAQRRMHVDVALGSTAACGAPPSATPAGAVRGIAAPPRHVKAAAPPPPPASAPAATAAPTAASVPARAASADAPAATSSDSSGPNWWARAALGLGAMTLLWLVLPRRAIKRVLRR
jgi:serine protease